MNKSEEQKYYKQYKPKKNPENAKKVSKNKKNKPKKKKSIDDWGVKSSNKKTNIKVSGSQNLLNVTGREPWSFIVGSDPFNLDDGTIKINPGDVSFSLPRLATFSTLFEYFRFNKLVFKYEPVMTATDPGNFIMCTDYDINDAAPDSGMSILSQPNGKSFLARQPFTYVVDLKISHSQNNKHRVKHGSDSIIEPAVYYPAQVFLGAEGFSTITGGYLWVEYDITFIDAHVEPNSLIYGVNGTINPEQQEEQLTVTPIGSQNSKYIDTNSTLQNVERMLNLVENILVPAYNNKKIPKFTVKDWAGVLELGVSTIGNYTTAGQWTSWVPYLFDKNGLEQASRIITKTASLAGVDVNQYYAFLSSTVKANVQPGDKIYFGHPTNAGFWPTLLKSYSTWTAVPFIFSAMIKSRSKNALMNFEVPNVNLIKNVNPINANEISQENSKCCKKVTPDKTKMENNSQSNDDEDEIIEEKHRKKTLNTK